MGSLERSCMSVGDNKVFSYVVPAGNRLNSRQQGLLK